jgi:hypothetical protein
MTPLWAQRQAELLRDCIVSPDVFESMVDLWFVSYHGGFLPDNMAQIPPKPLSIQHNDTKSSAT